ncbi:Isopentenyl-diphosphate Delta-isomerase [Vibrio stylophorae]|uniref:Isopentenyl-diphosphate Delta-isomerase n=1 Tax=Vibrio stylophorae TaxID=659351 RepID=A0ABN8DTK8_9VIBR|nr:isopentenyl-diphosphate Delta-isomerase [Vibrio stylophorae]CAH0534396.1 Isopentenyl-diphosphate Delta-isomerase [Vibrio stylophorae]
MTEFVVLVDQQGHPCGTQEKLTAHELGQRHLAFSVLLYRRRGDVTELLLQQRALHKYHCGGLWTNTCCSHPRPDEAIEAAVYRRLREEINLTLTTPLVDLSPFEYRAALSNGLVEHEWDHCFLAPYDGPLPPANPDEVMALEWQPLNHVCEHLAAHPHCYTPWFGQVLAKASTWLQQHQVT